jgi:hypothetical protein
MDTERAITIADLYPELSEAEQKEARENLDRYLELVVRIYERATSERSNSGSARGIDQSVCDTYDEPSGGQEQATDSAINETAQPT